MSTQYERANLGEITPEMEFVAKRENLAPELIRDEVAAGRMVIPANKNHLKHNLEPMCIGFASKTKINANIGNSAVTSDKQGELDKLDHALKYGADTVMDLSTGKDIDGIREAIIAHSPVPIGTVPIYQMNEQLDGEIIDMKPQQFLDVVEHQAQQGVDYMTIHCATLYEHLHLTMDRVTGIVSRGGFVGREMDDDPSQTKSILRSVRRPLRYHVPIRCDLEHGRRTATGKYCRCQR